jgi:glutaredoxin
MTARSKHGPQSRCARGFFERKATLASALSRSRLGLASLGLAGLLATSGCQRTTENESSPEASASVAPPAGMAPFSFADDSAGLLLTWVDEQGDFHVTQKPADVPTTARQTVRVVLQSQPAGSPETVFVTNLDQKGSDGRYPVRTMPRSAWDELGAARRKERMDRLAPPAAASAAPNGPLAAVIYGADWCKPCHAAEAYLKERGLDVTKKDIDESDAARAEMKAKLSTAGMSGSNIPVIDVAGTLLVGFSPSALDAAIRRAEAARKSAPAASR